MLFHEVIIGLRVVGRLLIPYWFYLVGPLVVWRHRWPPNRSPSIYRSARISGRYLRFIAKERDDQICCGHIPILLPLPFQCPSRMRGLVGQLLRLGLSVLWDTSFPQIRLYHRWYCAALQQLSV